MPQVISKTTHKPLSYKKKFHATQVLSAVMSVNPKGKYYIRQGENKRWFIYSRRKTK